MPVENVVLAPFTTGPPYSVAVSGDVGDGILVCTNATCKILNVLVSYTKMNIQNNSLGLCKGTV